jgi:hypothetical protein
LSLVLYYDVFFPSFCVIKHHAKKTHWESEGVFPHILNVGTRGR